MCKSFIHHAAVASSALASLGAALAIPTATGLVPLGSAQAQDAAEPATDDAAPTPRARGRRPRRVSFNLENANLRELVKLVSEITGRRFIIPSKIRDIEATIYAPRQVSAAQAYQAFLAVLEVNGMTVVPSGGYYKVTELGGIENRNLPVSVDGEGPAGEDSFVTHLHTVEYADAGEVAQLLGRFKSKEGNVGAYGSSMVIITDSGANVQRMLRIMQEIDVPRTGEQLWIEPIHHANASELAGTIEGIFAPGSTGGGSSKPSGNNSDGKGAPPGGGSAAPGTRGLQKIFADDRTNSLVILASEPAYLRVIELVRQFDVPLEGSGRVRVHKLKNGDAEEIATTLQSLISGNTGGSSGSTPTRGRARGSGSSTSTSGTLFEGEVRVTAHPSSNALVITSSLHDYAALKSVIEDLDGPRQQVFIEAAVMELRAQSGSNVGVSYHGGVPDVPTDGSLTVLGFQPQNSLSLTGALGSGLLGGAAAGVTGPLVENSQELFGVSIPAFGVIINALANSGSGNLLATPHIMAMDNTEAEITIGDNIPLQTSGIPPGTFGGLGALGALGGQQGQDAQGGLGGLGGLAGGLGTIPRQDVGTTIRITPHVGEQGKIRLEIEEEISEPGEAQGTLGVIPIQQRRAITQVVVDDQQTVVIGGLLRDRESQVETKVPVLGDIPLLGFLFRTRQKSKEKINLILVLTPYVIRNAADLRAVYERKMRERQEFIDRYELFSGEDYKPPIDYSRTRGLLAEMFTEMTEIERNRTLTQAAAGEAPEEHFPRAPVETPIEVIEPEPEDGESVVESPEVPPELEATP